MLASIIEIFKNEFVAFVVGTLIIGSIFNALARLLTWCLDHPNRGWTLTVVPIDDERVEYSSNLLPEEVKVIQHSQFRSRQFLQSVCSSELIRIKAGQIKTDDPNGWAYLDRKNRVFHIDFKKIPDSIQAKT